MEVYFSIDRAVTNLASDARVMLPEATLCGVMCLLLALRVFRLDRWLSGWWVGFAGVLGAALLTINAQRAATESSELFSGLLAVDPMAMFFRVVLVGFLPLFFVFSRLSGVPRRNDVIDVYVLVIGATFGMCLMVMANHLLMVFLAVEMASVPSYVLVGLLRGDKKSGEASMKYVVIGAAASGIMLYGISLLGGLLGATTLPVVATNLLEQMPQMLSGERAGGVALVLASLAFVVGLLFKLSAVPVQFWCPDVFEGASSEVNAFLSIASKAAAIGLLLRVVLAVALPADGQARLEPQAHLVSITASDDSANSVQDGAKSVREGMSKFFAVIALVTCLVGNLGAYGQNNIKRLLAYSTIAHAGYMMMAIPAVLVGADLGGDIVRQATSAVLVYVAVYLFMNLAAFCIAAMLRNVMHTEEIPDYAGLVKRSPLVVCCFAVVLFSLVGLPPFSGFVGKFRVFAAIGQACVASSAVYLWVLLIVGGLNTVLSLYYYLRVVKVMTLDPEPEGRVDATLRFAPTVFIVFITVPTILLGICWEWLNSVALAAVLHL